MGLMADIFELILRTLGTLYLFLIALRFLFQLVRADFYNPVSQAVLKATNPPLKPLRRFIPGIGGLDIAALVLLWLIQLIILFALSLIKFGAFDFIYLLLWTTVACVSTFLEIYFFSAIAYIICSFVAPGSHHPAILLLHQLINPAIRPFRKIIPPLGGLDLSPIFLFLGMNILSMILRAIAGMVKLAPQIWTIGLPF